MREQDPSYYSVLNVSRDASDADIKKAFRNLAQTYHPDKHSDSDLKAEASASFTLLQEAYEVWRIMLAQAAHACKLYCGHCDMACKSLSIFKPSIVTQHAKCHRASKESMQTFKLSMF